MQESLSKIDYELALLVALEFAINPPKSMKDFKQRLDAQPVNDRIKNAAGWLLIEMARSAKQQAAA